MIPNILVGTTVNKVNAPPMNAPRCAVFGFLAANTLSIKSRATISPNPNANMPAQLIRAPLAISVSPVMSKNSGGALLYIVSHSVPENPPTKNKNPAQNAPIARYTWNKLVQAEANKPPAIVYITTTKAESDIP